METDTGSSMSSLNLTPFLMYVTPLQFDCWQYVI